MSRIKSFEDSIAWQKSKELTLLVYVNFNTQRDFGFRDQIQRASVSVMNNIAEGFDRHSDKEFRQFLYIAKGSCAEVKSMLVLSRELGTINTEAYNKAAQLADETARVLGGLIKSLG